MQALASRQQQACAVLALQQLQAWSASALLQELACVAGPTGHQPEAAAHPQLQPPARWQVPSASTTRPRPWHPSALPQCLEHSRSLFGMVSATKSRKHRQRRLVGWSPMQMYQVVSDVEHYHKFVPWCRKSAITRRMPGGKQLDAELEVGFQLLVERYTSRVTLEPGRKVQSFVADSMLFHHLDSSWVMEPGPTPASCWLSFEVDFAFNNVLYGHLADVFFAEVVQRMVSAFEGRCLQLYGPSSLLRLQPGRRQQAPHAASPQQHTTRPHTMGAAHTPAQHIQHAADADVLPSGPAAVTQRAD